MNPDVTARCVASFSSLAERAALKPTRNGAQLRIGGHEFQFAARIENEQQMQGQHLVGVAVAVSIDGASDRFTAGTVGIGPTQAEALETAVSEWTQLVGVGLVGSIASRAAGTESLTVSEFQVFPGATGVRGSQDVAWSRESHLQLLALLEPILRESKFTDKSFHSVSIMFMREQGNDGGECRIDGTLSPPCLAALRGFPWPKPTEAYIFKQFYVVRPTQ